MIAAFFKFSLYYADRSSNFLKFSLYYADRFIFLWLLSFRRETVENFDSNRTLALTHECSVYGVRSLAYEMEERKKDFYLTLYKMFHSKGIKEIIIKYKYLNINQDD